MLMQSLGVFFKKNYLVSFNIFLVLTMKLLQHRKWRKNQIPGTAKSPVFRENHRKRQTKYNKMLPYQKKNHLLKSGLGKGPS